MNCSTVQRVLLGFRSTIHGSSIWFFCREIEKEITILVATSGDTGSAVAHGFLNVGGVKIIILYPREKSAPCKKKQLTGMGGNITALEVQGTFDDCQKLVKQAFSR